MAGTINYNRDKSTTINVTPIDIVPKVGEEPASAAALVGGSTGILNIEFEGDADETGGATLVNLCRIEDLQWEINSTSGAMGLTGSFIPVLGDGTDGTPVAISIPHPQTADTWQTAAGRPKQA